MNLHEYQTKELFSKYAIPTPKGKVIDKADQAPYVFTSLNSSVCAVKAQIHAGGRGKGGGIKIVKSPTEAKEAASKLLDKPLVTPQTGPEGKMVRKLLIEEGCAIARELYVGVIIDRNAKKPVLMVSAEGGMQIEELASKYPEKLIKECFDISTGLRQFQARKISYKFGLDPQLTQKFSALLQNISTIFIEKDCSLLEINPLVITKEGGIIAIDAKMGIDDRSLYLHPELEALRDIGEEDPRELEAAKHGLSYISMSGNIGCMVNGAGLAMSTMDIIKLYGGMPANFLDVGGGANKEQVATAFKLLLSNKDARAVLINIFGGILKCDVLAQGILDALKEVEVTVPVVVRLEGTNVTEGRKLLSKSGLSITPAADMTDAAKKVVVLAK